MAPLTSNCELCETVFIPTPLGLMCMTLVPDVKPPPTSIYILSSVQMCKSALSYIRDAVAKKIPLVLPDNVLNDNELVDTAPTAAFDNVLFVADKFAVLALVVIIEPIVAELVVNPLTKFPLVQFKAPLTSNCCVPLLVLIPTFPVLPIHTLLVPKPPVSRYTLVSDQTCTPVVVLYIFDPVPKKTPDVSAVGKLNVPIDDAVNVALPVNKFAIDTLPDEATHNPAF